ncbi:hypothetical protein BVX95_00150 [archaeon D22]|nr:hypothetical protein BVX95_00150 [archaeon D22]
MAKIHFITFGCSVNHSDSELMAGLLSDEGHKIVDTPEKSDLIIINTCTVKNSAETKLYRELKKHSDKKIIVAGCIPQGEEKLAESELKDYTIIGTKQMINVPFAVDETLKGNRVVILAREDNKRLLLPKIRENKTVEIIPINEGCIGSCTYCKTKQARGNIKSYAEIDILNQVKEAVKDGVTQVWLTSQDTGAYGHDTSTNIVELLNNILQIEGDFVVRLGMINPNHALQYLDGLTEILNHPKMFKFIHLPIQAASNSVLKDMNRKYTYEEYVEVVKTLRQNVEDLRIATDVIIGFPSETSKDFKKTLDFVKELKPEVCNMSRYWKRPNTLAATMKPLPTKEVKERSIKLKEVFEKLARKEKESYKGKEVEVIVEDNKLARTKNYIPVILKNEYEIGQRISLKINSVGAWDLKE